MGIPKNSSPKTFQLIATMLKKMLSWHENLKKEEVMEPIGSQMLPQHPLTFIMHHHGEHFHPKPLTKTMRKNNRSEKGGPRS